MVCSFSQIHSTECMRYHMGYMCKSSKELECHTLKKTQYLTQYWIDKFVDEEVRVVMYLADGSYLLRQMKNLG